MNGSICPVEEFALHPEGNGKPPKNFEEENDVIQMYVFRNVTLATAGTAGLSELQGTKPEVGRAVRRCPTWPGYHMLEAWIQAAPGTVEKRQ